MNKIALLACLLSISLASMAAEPITIFGLPLGGKLKTMPKVCPFSKIGDHNYRVLCWVDSPFIYKPTGSRLGTLQLPNEDELPKWAAYASFEATVSKEGNLDILKVKSSNGKSFGDIENSIHARFGPATKISKTAYSSATWDRPEIWIDVLCDNKELCMVEFKSPIAKADYDKEMAERAKKEARRAVSP